MTFSKAQGKAISDMSGTLTRHMELIDIMAYEVCELDGFKEIINAMCEPMVNFCVREQWSLPIYDT